MNLQTYTTRVQSGEHLLFDEMVTAAQLVFNEQHTERGHCCLPSCIKCKG